MTWGEFLRRGLTEDVDISYSDREVRQINYRLSDKYKRTFLECARLDLKVLIRSVRMRLKNGRRRS